MLTINENAWEYIMKKGGIVALEFFKRSAMC